MSGPQTPLVPWHQARVGPHRGRSTMPALSFVGMIGGEQPERGHGILWRWAGYGLSLVLVLSSSCRGNNPAFRDNWGPSTRADSGTSPEGQGNTTITEGPGTTAEKVTGTSATSTTKPISSQSQSESSSVSTSTSPAPFSSGGTVSSSGDTTAAASICDADAAFCFAMNYDEANKVFPEHSGKDTSLEPSDPAQIRNGADTNADASHFKNFLIVDKQGLVSSSAKVPTGTGAVYGVDIVLRNVGCSDQTRCSLALVTSLGLELNVPDKTIECVGYNDQSLSVARAVMALDFAAASTVGCFASNGRLSLYVNGKLALSSESYTLPVQQDAQLQVGVLTSSTMPGLLIAEIGRVQYWQDSERFKSAMEALSGQP